jgi:hypothetical protein
MSRFDDVFSADPFAGIPELEHDAEVANTNAPPKRDLSELYKFTEKCGACNGTGSFYSYTGRKVGRCFRCDGAGVKHYKTAPEDRKKAREQSRARKDRQRDENLKAVRDAYPAAFAYVEAQIKSGRGGEFYQSLYDQALKRGEWSEKQRDAIERSFERDKERAAKRERDAVAVDFTGIRATFNNALESGLKRPKLRAEGLVISLAGPNSANAGCLYVKARGDEYLGKITPEGKFYGVRSCTDDHKQALQRVSDDPLAAAVAYGRETGECSCCGRELTNAESIELGIGPICRDKWGM